MRTGRPIGSRRQVGNGYTDDWESLNADSVGVSGYGFFDAGAAEELNKQRSRHDSRRSVGRSLVLTEYS